MRQRRASQLRTADLPCLGQHVRLRNHLQQHLAAVAHRALVGSTRRSMAFAGRALALPSLRDHGWQAGQHTASRKLMQHIARRVPSGELVQSRGWVPGRGSTCAVGSWDGLSV